MDIMESNDCGQEYDDDIIEIFQITITRTIFITIIMTNMAAAKTTTTTS
jgi:hypothetical protein